MTKKATATIKYDVSTTHWPTESTLVQLNPPLRRYSVIDGSPRDFEYIIVHVRTPAVHKANAGVDIFPSDAEANPIDSTMVSYGQFDHAAMHSVLKQMGYEVTN
jgi:hypothetical protein